MTRSSVDSPYDEIATFYDELHPTSDAIVGELRRSMTSLRSKYPPSILDIGCGTGRVLDLGLTTPDRYAGVDPSQPMLNQLVRKHPLVARLYPQSIEQLLAEQEFTAGQFEIVTVVGEATSILTREVTDRLGAIASRGLIVISEADASLLSA